MKVRELVEILATQNPEADVDVSTDIATEPEDRRAFGTIFEVIRNQDVFDKKTITICVDAKWNY